MDFECITTTTVNISWTARNGTKKDIAILQNELLIFANVLDYCQRLIKVGQRCKNHVVIDIRVKIAWETNPFLLKL